jgi:hypothetical protein
VPALKLLVAATVGLGGLVVAAQAPAAAAGPEGTITVSAPVQSNAKFKSTPIEGGFSNYCAVVTMIPFNDLPGYEPTSVTVTWFNKPLTESIGPAPYDDNASQNGLTFPPVGAAHQTQIGDASYSQGAGDPAVAAQECEAMRQKNAGFYTGAATITFEATGKCASAIAKLATATKKVKNAKKKVASTTGRAHTAAVAALKQAKAKLKAAKKAAKKAC